MDMKTNWLWDSRLSEREVKRILRDEGHPKFDIYAEKLFSRVSDPAVAFSIVDKKTFCQKWPVIKKRMQRDRWIRNRVIFWQTIYEQVYGEFKKQGVKIRKPVQVVASPERLKIAQQIRNLRIKLGYTQGDLAKKLGVIQQYISKIETGKENISIDTLKKIADAFDCSLIIELG